MATQSMASADNRLSPRLEVNGLVYVTLPFESTFVLNLGSGGMGIQAMEVLTPGRAVPFAFSLPQTGTEVKGMANIVWTDCSGRAGLAFTNMAKDHRSLLKQWVAKNAN